MATRTTLKSYLETGDKPTQAQFAELIDSMAHKIEDAALFNLREYTNRSYALLECCIHNGKLYQANKATSGSFTAADWDVLYDLSTIIQLKEYDGGISYPSGVGCLKSGVLLQSNKATTGTYKPADWDVIIDQTKAGLLMFSPIKNYLAQQCCVYQGVVYQAKGNITAGAFDPTQWDAIISGYVEVSFSDSLNLMSQGLLKAGCTYCITDRSVYIQAIDPTRFAKRGYFVKNVADRMASCLLTINRVDPGGYLENLVIDTISPLLTGKVYLDDTSIIQSAVILESAINGNSGNSGFGCTAIENMCIIHSLNPGIAFNDLSISVNTTDCVIALSDKTSGANEAENKLLECEYLNEQITYGGNSVSGFFLEIYDFEKDVRVRQTLDKFLMDGIYEIENFPFGNVKIQNCEFIDCVFADIRMVGESQIKDCNFKESVVRIPHLLDSIIQNSKFKGVDFQSQFMYNMAIDNSYFNGTIIDVLLRNMKMTFNNLPGHSFVFVKDFSFDKVDAAIIGIIPQDHYIYEADIKFGNLDGPGTFNLGTDEDADCIISAQSVPSYSNIITQRLLVTGIVPAVALNTFSMIRISSGGGSDFVDCGPCNFLFKFTK